MMIPSRRRPGNGVPIRQALLACLLALALPVAAQQSETVRFSAGNDNGSVEASVTGDEYRDYVLGAQAGQTMGVSLSTEGSAYFNILPPGSGGEAIYNSSIEGNDATGIALPATGDYVVRVYLMGADEDEGRTVPFVLSMSIS
jgi:hypothetical protein